MRPQTRGKTLAEFWSTDRNGLRCSDRASISSWASVPGPRASSWLWRTWSWAQRLGLRRRSSRNLRGSRRSNLKKSCSVHWIRNCSKFMKLSRTLVVFGFWTRSHTPFRVCRGPPNPGSPGYRRATYNQDICYKPVDFRTQRRFSLKSGVPGPKPREARILRDHRLPGPVRLTDAVQVPGSRLSPTNDTRSYVSSNPPSDALWCSKIDPCNYCIGVSPAFRISHRHPRRYLNPSLFQWLQTIIYDTSMFHR